MEIGYYYQNTPMDYLEVDDIGNCYIEANTDLNMKFYFATRTRYGLTKVLVYGPVNQEYLSLCNKVLYKSITMDYNVAKLRKELDSMLNANSAKLDITQARVITAEEFKEAFVNPLNLFLEQEDEELDIE